MLKFLTPWDILLLFLLSYLVGFGWTIASEICKRNLFGDK